MSNDEKKRLNKAFTDSIWTTLDFYIWIRKFLLEIIYFIIHSTVLEKKVMKNKQFFQIFKIKFDASLLCKNPWVGNWKKDMTNIIKTSQNLIQIVLYIFLLEHLLLILCNRHFSSQKWILSRISFVALSFALHAPSAKKYSQKCLKNLEGKQQRFSNVNSNNLILI